MQPAVVGEAGGSEVAIKQVIPITTADELWHRLQQGASTGRDKLRAAQFYGIEDRTGVVEEPQQVQVRRPRRTPGRGHGDRVHRLRPTAPAGLHHPDGDGGLNRRPVHEVLDPVSLRISVPSVRLL